VVQHRLASSCHHIVSIVLGGGHWRLLLRSDPLYHYNATSPGLNRVVGVVELGGYILQSDPFCHHNTTSSILNGVAGLVELVRHILQSNRFYYCHNTNPVLVLNRVAGLVELVGCILQPDLVDVTVQCLDSHRDDGILWQSHGSMIKMWCPRLYIFVS
jgi:hypothetical protein